MNNLMIIDFSGGSLSRLTLAASSLAQARTPAAIAAAMQAERGMVPDADLLTAGVRRFAAISENAELASFCNRLDDFLED